MPQKTAAGLMFPPDPIPPLTAEQKARLAVYRAKRRVPLAPWRVRLGWWWTERRLQWEEFCAAVQDAVAWMRGA